MTVQDIDVRMIKRAARGDSDAFANLFDSEYQHVFRYAMWLCGDPDTAEDITQETFIRAHRGLDRLGPPYNIRAWLFRLAHNYHIDLTRRRDPDVPLDPDAPIAAHTPTPEAQIAFRELSTGVGMALGRLPTNQREVLVLREVEGLQYSDIAEVLGLSLDNVKVMLHRARATFKDHYAVRLLAEDPRPRCTELGELLDSFSDGDILPADQERRVRDHLKDCETCQQRKREIAAIALLLRGMHNPITPRRIRDRMMRRVGRARRLVRALILGGVVVLALTLGAGFVAAGGLPSMDEMIEALDRAGVDPITPEATETNSAVDAVSLTASPTGAVAAPPLPTDPNTRIEAVWACEHLGSNVFQWYEARVTYQDGAPISHEILSGPYTGDWQPNCPPAEPTPPPDPCQNVSCGNAVCEAACGETKVNCAVDCQACASSFCGDNVCDSACGEDPNNCAADCP